MSEAICGAHSREPLVRPGYEVRPLVANPLAYQRHCERSEAIHASFAARWIASSATLLAMTADRYDFAISPRIPREV